MGLSFPDTMTLVDSGNPFPELTQEQLDDPSTIPDDAKADLTSIQYDSATGLPNNKDIKVLGWDQFPNIDVPVLVSTFQAEATSAADYNNRIKVVTSARNYKLVIDFFYKQRAFAIDNLNKRVVNLEFIQTTPIFQLYRVTGKLDTVDLSQNDSVEKIAEVLEEIGAIPSNGYLWNRNPVFGDILLFNSSRVTKPAVSVPTPLTMLDRLLDINTATLLCSNPRDFI